MTKKILAGLSTITLIILILLGTYVPLGTEYYCPSRQDRGIQLCTSVASFKCYVENTDIFEVCFPRWIRVTDSVPQQTEAEFIPVTYEDNICSGSSWNSTCYKVCGISTFGNLTGFGFEMTAEGI